MGLSPDQLREWHFTYEFRETQRRLRVAEWARIDPALIRSMSPPNVKAALQIIHDYPASAKVDDGYVHSLLGSLIAAIANGDHTGPSIAKFKAAVDSELGADAIAKLVRAKRANDLADECVRTNYEISAIRKAAKSADFTDTSDALASIEVDLRQVWKQLRREAKDLASKS